MRGPRIRPLTRAEPLLAARGKSAPPAAGALSLSRSPAQGWRQGSGCPGERSREPCLALVLDPEGVDLRALRLGGGQLRASRVEDADDPHRFAGLDAERDDVLDLEVDGVADLDAVAQPFLRDFERG